MLKLDLLWMTEKTWALSGNAEEFRDNMQSYGPDDM